MPDSFYVTDQNSLTISQHSSHSGNELFDGGMDFILCHFGLLANTAPRGRNDVNGLKQVTVMLLDLIGFNSIVIRE